VITSLGVIVADARFGIWPATDAPAAREVVALVGGAALAALLGSLDDWFDLRARWQLAGQLVLAGWRRARHHRDPPRQPVRAWVHPPGRHLRSGLRGPVGPRDDQQHQLHRRLDGLSSGVALIAALTLGTISLTGPIDQPAVALFCFALAGSLLGFLRWNLHPASIFLGTSGVMVIGYVLALLSILGSAKVAVALLVLASRSSTRSGSSSGACRRPLALLAGPRPHPPPAPGPGLSHGQTVLVIYSVCIALAVLSLVLSGTGQLYAFLGVFVIFGLGLYLLSRAAGGDGAA